VDLARDSKFSLQIDRQACKLKNAIVGQEGRDLRHVTYFYNFGKAIDFKFGVEGATYTT